MNQHVDKAFECRPAGWPGQAPSVGAPTSSVGWVTGKAQTPIGSQDLAVISSGMIVRESNMGGTPEIDFLLVSL